MSLAATLDFPFATAPDYGQFREVAPGILWLRVALPFALNHVNLYLIEDDGGWALLDTGIADDRTRQTWEGLLAGGLGGRRITRMIVTHYHPDHSGLAGWIAERCGVEILMSQSEWLTAQFTRKNGRAFDAPEHRAFYRRHGMDTEGAASVSSRGHDYLRMTVDMPVQYYRLLAGETLRIGGRTFEILTGGGHAPEQVMLYCREARVFLPADQVLARISPNISVMGYQPDANPLALYLKSLGDLRAAIPDDVLVLPMHNMPFHGLHQRIDELGQHHDLRCNEVLQACAGAARTTAEVLPFLFPRALDVHQRGFAFGEVLAHINMLLRNGALVCETSADGVMRYRRV